MQGLFPTADAILHGHPRTDEAAGARVTTGRLLLVLVVGGLIYGAAMGAYTAGGLPRPLQVLYSGVKVPFLLVVTFLLALPSFFILNTLAGLRADFPQALRALLSTQAALTVVLASLAPLTLVWYCSSAEHTSAVLFNALMFAVASGAAQWFLRRAYWPLVAADARHRLMLRLWFFLYAFVGNQMGWVLRPFVGTPGMPTHFFRADSWGNAYEVVARLIWQQLGR